MYGIILGVVWQSTGFYMALMLAGLKSINIEIWQAARLDGVPFWRLYLEVIIPMMKLTFLTSILLLSIGVVKAYDIIVAMTNGGPGGSSYVPAYFAIQAYWVKQQSRLRLGRRDDHAADHGVPASCPSSSSGGGQPHDRVDHRASPRRPSLPRGAAASRSSRTASRSSSSC